MIERTADARFRRRSQGFRLKSNHEGHEDHSAAKPQPKAAL